MNLLLLSSEENEPNIFSMLYFFVMDSALIIIQLDLLLGALLEHFLFDGLYYTEIINI